MLPEIRRKSINGNINCLGESQVRISSLNKITTVEYVKESDDALWT